MRWQDRGYLARLDVVVGAVHSKFNLSRVEQTQRILRAMENKHLAILAHPSGRLMLEREPYDVDITRIISAAPRNGCFAAAAAKAEGMTVSLREAGLAAAAAPRAGRPN